MNTKLDLYNQKGKVIGSFELDRDVFDGKVNMELMHIVVKAYLANQRQGTASTKTRGEVRGGGKKPWRQKGTGRARVGSIRSPLWRKGGIVFGPKPRDYSQKLPKRMINLALKSALNAKLIDGEILVIDDIDIDKPKTKEIFGVIKNLQCDKIKKIRIVVDNLTPNIKLSSRNLPNVELSLSSNLCTYEVLDNKKIIFVSRALEDIQKRIKRWSN